MSSVSKHQVLLVCSYELVTRMIGCVTSTAQIVVSESVKFLALRPKCWVAVDGERGHLNVSARGNVLSIGEGDALENLSVE